MRWIDILLPDSCASCREDAPARGAPVCLPCRRALRRLAPPPSPGRLPPGIRLIRAAFPYAEPLPALLRAFKYDGREKVGAALARRFASRWTLFPELRFAHAFVAVPLHPRKRRLRGFNQAEILARAAAERAGVPALSLLRRRVDGPAQAGLTGEARRGRLRGAFHTREGIRLDGARLVLVDDVATTGETLTACAAALIAAGASDVRAFVLAFSWRDFRT